MNGREKTGVLIHPADNVVTVVEEVSPGDVVQYVTPDGPRHVTAADAVPFGHKVALADLASGEKVVKYNEVIGTASEAIARGRHVHAHNVRSAVQGGAR